MTSSKQQKPNFKVKHPYGYLVRSILLGIILVCTAVLGCFTVNIFNKGEKASVEAATTGDWDDYRTTESNTWFQQNVAAGNKTWIINTPEQLAELAYQTRAGGFGFDTTYTFNLVADLDMSAHTWQGIGPNAGLNGSGYTSNFNAKF